MPSFTWKGPQTWNITMLKNEKIWLDFNLLASRNGPAGYHIRLAVVIMLFCSLVHCCSTAYCVRSRV